MTRHHGEQNLRSCLKPLERLESTSVKGRVLAHSPISASRDQAGTLCAPGIDMLDLSDPLIFAPHGAVKAAISVSRSISRQDEVKNKLRPTRPPEVHCYRYNQARLGQAWTSRELRQVVGPHKSVDWNYSQSRHYRFHFGVSVQKRFGNCGDNCNSLQMLFSDSLEIFNETLTGQRYSANRSLIDCDCLRLDGIDTAQTDPEKKQFRRSQFMFLWRERCSRLAPKGCQLLVPHF